MIDRNLNGEVGSSNQYLGLCEIDSYIKQIRDQLMIVKSDYYQLSPEQEELIEMFPQHSIIRSVLYKCICVKARLGELLEDERQIVFNSLDLLKQIQSDLTTANYYHNKNKLTPKLVQNYENLTHQLKQLPLFQVWGSVKTQAIKKTPQNSQNMDQLLKEVKKLRRQRTQLQRKIKKYQEGASSIENKLVQLFQHSLQEQIKMEQKGKVIERICQNVYSQHFMIQANFDIRNQFYYLKKENEKLKEQVDKSRTTIQALRKKHQAQISYLVKMNKKLQSDNKFRSQNKIEKSMKELQEKMADLQNLRLRDERIIISLHRKIENLSLANTSYNGISIITKNASPKNYTKHFPASVEYQFQQTKEHQRAYSYKQQENQHKKIKAEQQIKYSKSTCALLQPFQTPKSSQMRINKQAHVQFLQKGSNDEDLKTSGFFLQPEDYLYFSNQAAKRKQTNTIKRTMECRTPSTLS